MKKLDCILLVDDNPADNYLHKLIIEESGFADHVFEALNGQEALDFLNREGKFAKEKGDFPRPNMIFLDINMPVMNGFEFLEKYHVMHESKKADALVMMLTTSLNPDDVERAKQYPEMVAYRHKPLNEEMMKEIIEQYDSFRAKS